ncbi:hypothetical protein GCM10009536_24060 [Streptomyces thermocarboxydus]
MGGAVTWGLLGAWAVHDLEELATVPWWLRRNVPELRKRFPQVPEGVWRRAESMGAAEFAAAVGVTGAVVGTASAAGRLSGGRSGFYQGALTGFGLHGVVHMAQARTRLHPRLRDRAAGRPAVHAVGAGAAAEGRCAASRAAA